MFTGTADGRIVKLENGEIETIARFGSGPCSKSVTAPPDTCLWSLRKVLNGCVELNFPRSQVDPWRRRAPDQPGRQPDLGVTTSSSFAVWSLDLMVPDCHRAGAACQLGGGPCTFQLPYGPCTPPFHSGLCSP